MTRQIHHRAPEAILAAYEQKVAGWRASEMQTPELRPLTSQELQLLDARLHRTRKQESIALTVKIVKLLAEKRILTTEEICAELHCHDVPVRNRMRTLRAQNLVRLESRLYHLATPRLTELVEQYLEVMKWL